MPTDENQITPLHVFRFQVEFKEAAASDGQGGSGSDLLICSGAFSQVSGLEATMEPFVIREGGQNYGTTQRVGRVTFATVILKRGMTTTRHLWHWWDLVTGGAYAYRLDASITMFDIEGNPILAWTLRRAMPVKFKAADLDALSNNVAVEELHIVHEGLQYGRLQG